MPDVRAPNILEPDADSRGLSHQLAQAGGAPPSNSSDTISTATSDRDLELATGNTVQMPSNIMQKQAQAGGTIEQSPPTEGAPLQHHVDDSSTLHLQADGSTLRLSGRTSRGAEQPPVSFARLTVNMVLCGLGAGILSLPWTMAGAGVVNAMFWNAADKVSNFALSKNYRPLAVLILSYFTMMMMVKAGERHGCFDMEALLQKCELFGISGMKWRTACTVSIWICYWIALVGYLIIISDSVVPTWKAILHHDIDRRFPVLGGALVILPLCFLSQRALAVTSLFGVFANCFVVFAVVFNYYVTPTNADKVCGLGFTAGNITYVSAICMAMVIQPCILPMYETMERRSPARFSQVLIISFSILWGLFTSFSFFAYLSFGSQVDGNVLKNLPANEWYAIVANGGMGIVCIGVYPLMIMPMVSPLESAKAKTTMTFLILATTTLGACSFDKLGTLNVMCGALSTLFFIALFPPIIGVSLLKSNRLAMGGIFVVGTLSFIFGLIFNDNMAGRLVKNCTWAWESTKPAHRWWPTPSLYGLDVERMGSTGVGADGLVGKTLRDRQPAVSEGHWGKTEERVQKAEEGDRIRRAEFFDEAEKSETGNEVSPAFVDDVPQREEQSGGELENS